MKTIVIASQKGGSGKTTLAAHLAVAVELAGKGPSVLIDTDPQGSLSAWRNNREAETPAIAQCLVRELPEAIADLDANGAAYCFVDTPPAIGAINASVIAAADLVLIPSRASPHDLAALGSTIDLCNQAGRPFCFVVNQAKRTASITVQTVAALSEHGAVCPTLVGDRVSYASSMVDGRTVMELDPRGPATEEVNGVLKFVLSRLSASTRKRSKE